MTMRRRVCASSAHAEHALVQAEHRRHRRGRGREEQDRLVAGGRTPARRPVTLR